MRPLVLSFFLALSIVFLAAEARAQGAPVREGVTNQDLAAQAQVLQRNNAELRLELGDMEREVAQLTGKVETLQFLLSQTRDEVNRMQGDDKSIGEALAALDARLDALDRRMGTMNERVANLGTQSAAIGTSGAGVEQTVTAGSDSGAGGPEPANSPQGGPAIAPQPMQTGSLGTISAADLPGEAGPLFAEAKARLLQFDYAGAEAAFSDFLSRFGDDPQAGEAQYWLAEVLFQQEEYAASGQAYTEMIRAYPDDPRAADALVKLARSMRLVGDATRACAALDALPTRYPNASGVTRNLAAVERTRSACDG
ncbi:MAG: tol-pal system protein YbgF [Pseudomonadota bacterium]